MNANIPQILNQGSEELPEITLIELKEALQDMKNNNRKWKLKSQSSKRVALFYIRLFVNSLTLS